MVYLLRISSPESSLNLSAEPISLSMCCCSDEPVPDWPYAEGVRSLPAPRKSAPKVKLEEQQSGDHPTVQVPY